MLNKEGQRELCFVGRITAVNPIQGADSIELVTINGGWTCIAKIGEFKEQDLCIYFEIDSKLPEGKEWSEFLAPRHYKVKTMKLGKFGVVSQGLALPASAFGWKLLKGNFPFEDVINTGKDMIKEGDFLTERLGVVYSVVEDNSRKASKNPDAKINAALARHPKIAKKYGKFIKKYKFTRWFFVFLFGKKRDVRDWPQEVQKTDEERIENRAWTLNDREKIWIATEKVDGASSTFHLRRGKGMKKPEYFVCSRNVVFNTPEKEDKNFYKDTIGNIWIEMDQKYDMQNKLQQLLDERPSAEWVTLQGETFGQGVQKRDYGMKDHDLRAFNLIYSDCGRVGTLEMKEILDKVGIPSVPIISEGMTLPGTIEELREFVHSAPSAIDGKMKEGIVFRTQDGTESFKCVDPEFLLKYHQ